MTFVSNIGKWFACTDNENCDGSIIQVYCVDWDIVIQDYQDKCAHAPFCAGDTVLEGGTLNIECDPHDKIQEIFVCTLDDASISGDYKFHLYYEGVETCDPMVAYIGVGESYAQWWGYGREEVWYNGNYKYEIENPNGDIIHTQNFVVAGGQESTCNQLVKVVNPALQPIEGASVVVPISETVSKMCYTDSDGVCYINDLTIDSMYTAHASKEGYEDYKNQGCRLFDACIPYAVLCVLHKPCEQGFLVSDQNDNPVKDAIVTATPIDRTCITNADGWCSIELSEDCYYDVEATKDGYRCYDGECKREHIECVPHSSMVLKLQEGCETTGIACDAKISSQEVPVSAPEGSDVHGTVRIDNLCLLPHEATRYRVKFTINDNPSRHTDSFILGPYNWIDMPFNFIMPDHDVAMIVEIERCNKDGKWENAGPEYQKEYLIHVGTPEKYTFNVIVKDENGNPVPDALIDTDAHNPLFYYEKRCTDENVTVTQGTCGGPETAFADDEGYNIITDSKGQASFVLPGLAFPDNHWGLRVGKPGYYNEKGKEGWTNYLTYDVPNKTYSVAFTLFITAPPQFSELNALVYGAAAAGLYVGGSIISGASPKAKTVGTALKLGTLIPAGLCGYELYKWIEEQWWS